MIPEAGSCRNPVDVTAQVTHNQPEKLQRIVELLADEGEVTSILVGVNHRCLNECWSNLIQTAERSGKLLGITVSGDVPATVKEGLKKSKRALVGDAEEVLWMLKTLEGYAKSDRAFSEMGVTNRWDKKEYLLRRPSSPELTEHEVKGLLSRYISIPRGELAHTKKQAVEIADRLGYPVAMKLVAPGLRHKTEAGAVKLNVSTSNRIAEVYEDLLADPGSDRKTSAVLVEEMVRGGVEVIVGFLRTKELGPVVMFGSGGVLVELVRDTTYRSIPIEQKETERMIEECLCYRLMKGFRNQPDKDIDSLVDAIVKASRVFKENPWILEMEFNPVAVLDRGHGIRVLDALVVAEDARPG
jgi:acyl-CoA synthetase (NDP forming)